MKDPREEIGRRFSLTGKIVRSWMMWAGHSVGVEADRLQESRGGETARPRIKGDHNSLTRED